MNYYGIASGILSLLIIGLWHPIVIKGEYYIGRRICTVFFTVIGIVCVILSLYIDHAVVSMALALFGFSAFWGIKETAEQEERVKKGWFPENPKKKSYDLCRRDCKET